MGGVQRSTTSLIAPKLVAHMPTAFWLSCPVQVRKKILKPSEKFRFNFDWEANDDTSRDLNPLYNNTHEAALLFGRGLRAGVDRREQMKAAAAHQRELMRKQRESTVRAPVTPPCLRAR